MQPFLEALKYLPENINAAKSSPLGVVCLLLSLAFLLCLAFFFREGWKVKAGVLAGFFVCGFVGLLVGNSERTAARPVSDPPTTSMKPAGKVVDTKGDPVANAKVSIDPGGIPSFVLTTSDGGFQFNGFQPSANVQQLSVSHPDFENFVMNLRPDEIGTYQRLQLRSSRNGAKPAPVNKAVILSGRVLDDKGQPIENAEVTVEAGGDNPQLRTAYTRSDGAYSIEGFQRRANTVVVLRVRAKGFDPVSRDIDPSDRRIQEVRLAPAHRSAQQRDSQSAAPARG
jgi:hypothetical protein